MNATIGQFTPNYVVTPPPLSPTTPQAPPPSFSAPSVSFGPSENEGFNYTVTPPPANASTQTANANYPLFTQTPLPSFVPPNVSLTGPVGGDAFTSSATRPFSNQYTTTPTLPAPFISPKVDTTAFNNGNQQIKLNLDALLDPRNQAVSATAPVTTNPFGVPATTTIPGYPTYPGQPGSGFSMLA